MEILYYLPPKERFDPDRTPVLFVLHGLQRDPENYYAQVMASGEVQRLGIFLLVPHFSEELFPKRAGYNFGHIFKEDPLRWQEKGKRGLPPVRSHEHTAFAALEFCFDAARSFAGSRAASYTLFGHSAGAQFAHRFALFSGRAQSSRSPAEGSVPAFRASRIVVANAGWYTMPHFAHKAFDASSVFPFPYSLDLLDEPHEVVRAFLQMPMMLLLGEEDTDPSKPRPEIWVSTPATDAQGPHRLARGTSFFEAGLKAGQALGVECKWTMKTVPGVGHAGGKMAAVAIRMLFDPAANGEVDVSVLKAVPDGDLA